ncbi:hypothetical protein J2X31_003595 [Flavobacterium arsenatis]|uniref:HEAT repeat domain-containing protein n=1 Tax=Flavobacterium arsenatis TaxID=1484332 RepID=A0ABU1TUK7_9FLAO|nr:hypothetical protein [Flavobacterium arsenatis]
MKYKNALILNNKQTTVNNKNGTSCVNLRVGGNFMMTTKDKLRQLVSDFRQWLADNYTSDEIEELRTDDAGYPKWEEITTYFSELIDKKLLRNLDKEDQINLLYLIGRNWDIGNMIAWLSKGTKLSNCGELEKKDFLSLAKTLTELEQPEFNDAKSQIASSFQKFDKLTTEIEEILLKLYNDKDEYTKRLSLISLGKLGFYDIKQLIKQSWETIEDEHHKIGCLFVIAEYIKDDKLMKHYLQLADKQEGEYLKSYVYELIRK